MKSLITVYSKVPFASKDADNELGGVRNWLRALLFPGLDLHTRNRASLCKFWQTRPRDVLDAGFGNGYFSWLAYKSGARVLALNMDQEQVDKARDFLLAYKKAEPSRLRLEHFNLYDLPEVTQEFDEVICYEVLEHLGRDSYVLGEFYRLLRPGGMLHLCTPYRLHPHHLTSELDLNETGGHVRPGYTEEDYRALLEPLGFHVDVVVGIGPRGLCSADRILRAIRVKFGDLAALPLLPFCLPLLWLARFNPAVPFSLYVRAIKPRSA